MTLEEKTIQRSDLPQDPALDEMIQAGVFFGRKKSKTNPKMRPYVFLNRGGIELFDLYKTQSELVNALKFLEEERGKGKIILLVGTHPAAGEEIEKLASEFNLPYVSRRWVGGTLSNFKIIAGRINYFKKLAEDFASKAFEKYTKKERLNFERELARLDLLFGGLKTLEKLPDVLLVIDPVIHKTAVMEARRVKIPVVAFVNTDCDLDLLDYFVPGNTLSKKSVAWFLGKVREVFVRTPVLERVEDEKRAEQKIGNV